MSTYLELANSVAIDKKNRLISKDKTLQLIGTGRSAFVFKIQSTNKAIKVFFPGFIKVAKEEAEIYHTLQGIRYFPSIYEVGLNYLVMDYIEGHTLFECITKGNIIKADHIKEIDYALKLATDLGLNPSDIHLRNIMITPTDDIRLIDVARYRQVKDCKQWSNLKKAYFHFYGDRPVIKRVPSAFLNAVAYIYKKRLIPFFRE